MTAKLGHADHTTDEVWILANYHLDILRHRFPSYECTLDELPPYWICVHVGHELGALQTKIMIFMTAFTSSCVQITTPPFKQDLAIRGEDQCDILTIEYADPNFTDDTLSDILRELESIAQRKGWPNVEQDHKGVKR